MTQNRNALTVAGIVLILIAVVAVVYVLKHKASPQEITPGTPKVIIHKPVITEVKIEPEEPTTSTFIRVRPTLLNPNMLNSVTFHYQWYIDGRIVPGEDGKLLDKKYFKKGDKVYCRVRAVKGALESDIVTSDAVEIGNSPPEIRVEEPIFSFQPPGRFEYNIDALDPDGDTLTYRLIAPTRMGIRLNPETGQITWDIEEKKKTRVTIIFEVSDSGAAAAQASFTLDLSGERIAVQ